MSDQAVPPELQDRVQQMQRLMERMRRRLDTYAPGSVGHEQLSRSLVELETGYDVVLASVPQSQPGFIFLHAPGGHIEDRDNMVTSVDAVDTLEAFVQTLGAGGTLIWAWPVEDPGAALERALRAIDAAGIPRAPPENNGPRAFRVYAPEVMAIVLETLGRTS